MEKLHHELVEQRQPSPLCVRGLAQALAVHLVRNSIAENLGLPRSF